MPTVQRAVGCLLQGVGVLLFILGIALAVGSESFSVLLVPCLAGLVLIVLGRKFPRRFRRETLEEQRKRLERGR